MAKKNKSQIKTKQISTNFVISTISQVHVTSGELLAAAVPPARQQAAAESTINKQEDHPSAKSTSLLKNDLLNPGCLCSKTNSNLQPFSVTTEVLDEFKMGVWCLRGTPNIEETMSEESDALWEAYRELGVIEDHQGTEEQCDSVEKAVNKQLPMDKGGTLELLWDESEDEKVHLKQRTLKVCYTGCSISKCFIRLKLWRDSLRDLSYSRQLYPN